MPEILVVGGSVRQVRRSPKIAAWVAGLGETLSAAVFHVVDLRDLGLAMDDEPTMAAKGLYARESTRRWSERVSGAAALVLVTPQYNWGYPAALKNAVDHLYAEWRDKPVLVVTYGARGGDKCAAQLREVMTGLKARVAGATPGLRLSRSRIDDDDGGVDPETEFSSQREEVEAALRELAASASIPLKPPPAPAAA